MPRLSKYPTPKIRFHGDRWRIYWYWNKNQYSIATLHTDPKTDPKKSNPLSRDLRLVSSALAMDDPAFPTEYQNDPGVVAYMRARFPEPDPLDSPSTANNGDWLEEYAKEMKGECSPKWVKMSMVRLRALDKDVGGIATLTPENASKYLAKIASTRKTGTRNRFLGTFTRFYEWAIRTERIKTKVNPFTGIKFLKEEKPLDIVYCTKAQRAEIIEMARATDREEWLSVPIAFYSGMRKEEIANLEWPDIRFSENKLVVGRTKTKKGRLTPLSSTLRQYLQAIPESERTGYVVKISDGIDRLYRMDNLMRKIRKMKKEAMLSSLSIEKPSPSRSKEYKAQKKAYEAERQKLSASIKSALDRIGWNAWRHTFGSILAQKNTSIDKISSWMGNTPEVCRRHYTQFIPQNEHDLDIDKLD